MSIAATLSHPAPHSAVPSPLPLSVQLGTSRSLDDDQRSLQSIGTKLRVSRNQIIFHEGDPAAKAYKVVSGTVRLVKHLADGRRQVLQFLFSSDFFGIGELGNYGVTAEAVSDVVIMSYSQQQLALLADQRPSLQQTFLTLLSQRVTDVQRHLMVLGRQHAKERIASFLLQLAERTGSEDDDLMEIPMDRRDIADYLGLRIETVSRVLTEMKEEGLIEAQGTHQFVLSDADALQEIADGEE